MAIETYGNALEKATEAANTADAEIVSGPWTRRSIPPNTKRQLAARIIVGSHL
jgi:hypothetical protein